MIKLKLILFTTLALYGLLQANNATFKEYCWGCHHETSVAFGPSFEQIANTRTKGQIQGHIIAPASTYLQLGYTRTVMPSFKDELSQNELDSITSYILKHKSQ